MCAKTNSAVSNVMYPSQQATSCLEKLSKVSMLVVSFIAAMETAGS